MICNSYASDFDHSINKSIDALKARDGETALSLLKPIIEKTDKNIFHLLGQAYYITGQNNKAFEAFLNSEYLKYPYVLNQLGHMYFLGEGTKKDYKEAEKYLRHLVSYNINPKLKKNAFRFLGIIYRDGDEDNDLEPDPTLAKKYFKEGSRLGSQISMYFLIELILKQEKVSEKEYDEVRYWVEYIASSWNPSMGKDFGNSLIFDMKDILVLLVTKDETGVQKPLARRIVKLIDNIVKDIDNSNQQKSANNDTDFLNWQYSSNRLYKKALLISLINRNVNYIELFLKVGVNPFSYDYVRGYKGSPIENLIRRYDEKHKSIYVEILELIKKHGFKLDSWVEIETSNARDIFKATPEIKRTTLLHLVAFTGNRYLLSYLLSTDLKKNIDLLDNLFNATALEIVLGGGDKYSVLTWSVEDKAIEERLEMAKVLNNSGANPSMFSFDSKLRNIKQNTKLLSFIYSINKSEECGGRSLYALCLPLGNEIKLLNKKTKVEEKIDIRPEFVPQKGNSGAIVYFSNNSDKDIVMSSDRSQIILWQGSTGTQIRAIDIPGDTDMNDLSLSGDGRYIYGINFSGKLYIWETKNGKLKEVINNYSDTDDIDKNLKGDIWSDYLDYSVKKNLLLVDGYEGFTVKSINNKNIYNVGEVKDVVNGAISENGLYITLLTENGGLKVWDVDNKRLVASYIASELNSYTEQKALIISNDGEMIVGFSDDRKLWSVNIKKRNFNYLLDSVETEKFDFVKNSTIRFSPNNRYLSFNYYGFSMRRSKSKFAKIFDLAANEEVSIHESFKKSHYHSFDEDSNLIIMKKMSPEREVHKITNDGSDISYIYTENTGRYKLLNDDLKNEYITISDTGEYLLDLKNVNNDSLLEINTNAKVIKFRFSELTQQMVKRSADIQFIKWNIKDNVVVNEVKIKSNLMPHKMGGYDTKFYYNNGTILFSTEGDALQSFNFNNKDLKITRFEGFSSDPGFYKAIAFSNSGKFIAIINNNTLQVWNVSSGSLEWQLNDVSLASNITFSPNDEFITTTFHSYSNNNAVLEKYVTKTAKRTRKINSGYSYFSSDGRLAAKYESNLLAVYNIENDLSPKYLFSVNHQFNDSNDAFYNNNYSLYADNGLNKIVINFPNKVQVWKKGEHDQYSLAISKNIKVPSFFDETEDLNLLNNVESISKINKRELDSIDTYTLTSNGKYLIGHSFGALYYWNTENTELVKIVKGQFITSIGDYVLLKKNDRVLLVDTNGFEVIREIDNKDDMIVKGHIFNLSSNLQYLAVLVDDVFRLWSLDDGSLRLYFSSFGGVVESNTTTGWVWSAPNGKFDTDNLDNISAVNWVFSDMPYKPLSAEVFLRDFYSPKILSNLALSEVKDSNLDFSGLNRIQPKVEITQIEYIEKKHQAKVDLLVKSISDIEKELESGIHDIHLLMNGRVVKRHPNSSLHNKNLSWNENTRLSIDVNKQVKVTLYVDLPHNVHNRIKFEAFAFNSDRVKSVNSSPKWLAIKNSTKIKPRAWVISIGVNDNETSTWRLSYATPSAKNISRIVGDKLIKSSAFTEVTSIPLYVRSDLDRLKAINSGKPDIMPPTKSNIRAVLRRLSGIGLSNSDKELFNKYPHYKFDKIRPDDLVFISFSGHGIVPENNSEFYMLPHDTGGYSNINKDLFNKSISSKELAGWLSNIKSINMSLFLDTCTSGAALAVHNFKPAPLGNPGLGQLSYDKGMPIFVSAQAGESANAFGMSLATKQFVKLISKTSRIDDINQITEIMSFVKLDHTNLSANDNVIQVPKLYNYNRKSISNN